MKTRLIFVLLLFAMFATQGQAVLKEENLDKTVRMLDVDLKNFYKGIEAYMRHHELQRQEYNSQIRETYNECQEFAMELYTQNDFYIFGITEASKCIKEKYIDFCSEQYPFDVWRNNFKDEINRYERIGNTLSRVSNRQLSPEGKKAKSECIAYCEMIAKRMAKECNLLDADSRNFRTTAVRIKKLEEYSQYRFDKVKQKMLVDGSESYFVTLAHFNDRLNEAFENLNYEYSQSQLSSSEWMHKRFQWGGTILLLLLLCLAGGELLSRFALPRIFGHKKDWDAKRAYFTATLTCFLFAVGVLIFSGTIAKLYYFITTLGILCEYSIILGVALLSLTLRLEKGRIRSGLMMYLPQLILAGVLISYRILMVSTYVISFSLPAVLLVFTLFQLSVNIYYALKAKRTDSVLSWLSFAVMSAVLIVSWTGYRLLSMELMTFWIIFMTSVQAIVCLYALCRLEEKGKTKIHSFKSWFIALMYKLVLPLLALFSSLGSLIWTADIFCLKPWMLEMLDYKFINLPNVITVSVNAIVLVLAIGLVVRTLIYAIKTVFRTVYGEQLNMGGLKIFVSIGTILIWGLYICIIVVILKINNNGLIAAIGGTSMGIGFALKDTIDNLFCGLSLMMGRVHVGDVVECDDMVGTVDDIGIRSTIITTGDGAIIAFLNSQLFAKNFRNLTKNNDYLLCAVDVRIKYGEDFEAAADIIKNAVKQVAHIDQGRGVDVQLTGFGDNSVELKVQVWVRVAKRSAVLSEMRTVIYDAFEKNGIEVPYMQRGIQVINLPSYGTEKKERKE